MAIPWVEPVLTAEIPQYWSELKPHIDRVQKRCFGEWSTEDIYQQLIGGECQAFLIRNPDVIGVVVTKIHQHYARKALHFQIVSGQQFSVWLPLMEAVFMPFAKKMGCTVITGSGRRGWIKALQAFDAREESVNYSIEVR